MVMIGIYQITNLVNGKRYIGLSNNIKRRFMEHKTPKNFCSKNNVLYKSIRKYGLSNFYFEVLEEVENIESLPQREVFWIDKLKPEYNMNDGGLGNCGFTVSKETKSKLKSIGKSQWLSKSSEEKNFIISNNLKGPRNKHEVLPETRAKLALANIGKKQSEETKRKRSESMKIATIGNKNGNKKVIAIKNGIETIYSSVIEASKSTGVCTWGIRQVTHNKALTSKGYEFKFINN